VSERSRAAITLGKSAMQQSEIAKEVGVSAVSVHHWLQGVKRPGPEKRERIAELSTAWDCGRVEPEWWDDIPPRDTSAPPSVTRPLPRGDLTAQLKYLEDRAADLARTIDEAGTPERRIRALAHLTRVLRDIANVRATERKGFRENPMWRATLTALMDALRPFPEAANAVRERFLRLDIDG
jgi:transcriptional regulator with XRE-family HTH domain